MLLWRFRTGRAVDTSKQGIGDRIADALTGYIGSWPFVIWFNLSVLMWVGANLGLPHPFDPWPFILLNLVFSWIAGVQGPIIMISQRRQERITVAMAKHHLAVSKACQVALEGQSHVLAGQATLIASQSEELKLLREDLARQRAAVSNPGPLPQSA